METASGLFLLGMLLVVMDFLMAKLTGKLNPNDSSVSKDLRESEFASNGEYRRYKMRRANLLAIQSHTMRRSGIIISAAGLIAFLVLLCVPEFQSLPNQSLILRMSDLLTISVKTPWGHASVSFAIILAVIAYFLFLAGREQWKLRGNYPRALACFAFGSLLFLEAIFQWG